MIDVLVQSICISLFCGGLWVATDEGYIFSFLRNPYNEAYDEQEKTKDRINAGFSYDKQLYQRRRLFIAVLKPVIGCVVCYSSFWTIVLHTALYGFEWAYIPVIIMHIFMVCALNSIFLNIYE